jgi:hypothetical protein
MYVNQLPNQFPNVVLPAFFEFSEIASQNIHFFLCGSFFSPLSPQAEMYAPINHLGVAGHSLSGGFGVDPKEATPERP